MMIPQYNTKYFTQIYDSAESFAADYGLFFPKTIKDTNITTLFYLLYAKYGNSPIANLDENQFKAKLFSIIFQYGKEWERKLEIQDELSALSLDDVIDSGYKQIFNNAFNPETAPSTLDTEELQFVSEQKVMKTKKDKLSSAAELWNLISRTDVTRDFILRFSKLFNPFARPQINYIYISED